MNEFIKRNTALALGMALAVAPALVHAQVELEVGGEAGLGATIDSATDASATLNGTMVQAELGVSSSDAAADQSAASGDIAIVAAAQVRSDDDLETFERNAAANATSVEAVSIKTNAENTTAVEVDYEHPGKLFGLMPVTMTSKAAVTVHNNGVIEVSVKLPWWSIVVGGTEPAETDIETRLRDNPTIMTNAEAGLSARSKAEIAEAIITELEASMTARGQIEEA